MSKTAIIIPARLESQRLPRKPLLMAGGKTILQHTWEAAMVSGVGDVFIATDSTEVVDAVHEFGGEIKPSTREHPNGTSRIAEASELLPADYDIIINLQCDEPLAQPEWLHGLRRAAAWSKSGIATLVTPLTRQLTLEFHRHIVKAMVDAEGVAFGFHRACELKKHIGIYGFRRQTLQDLVALEPSVNAVRQSLEQLTWLDAGYEIQAVEVLVRDEHYSIDTPEDYKRFCKRCS